jgi:hypothetical protein
VEYAAALVVLLCLVALVVARPLVADDEPELRAADARRDELEAAKEAKYREIRDAELDHEMGKLSREDYRALDRELREEAIEILAELDRLDPDSR